MLNPRDLKPLPTAVATAAAAGLALGLWVSPPAAILNPPPAVHPPGLIDAQDPNLAHYHQMLAEQGIDPSPVVPVANVWPVADRVAATDDGDNSDAAPADPGDDSDDGDDDASLPRSVQVNWSAADQPHAGEPEQPDGRAAWTEVRPADDAGQAPSVQSLAQRIWGVQ